MIYFFRFLYLPWMWLWCFLRSSRRLACPWNLIGLGCLYWLVLSWFVLLVPCRRRTCWGSYGLMTSIPPEALCEPSPVRKRTRTDCRLLRDFLLYTCTWLGTKGGLFQNWGESMHQTRLGMPHFGISNSRYRDTVSLFPYIFYLNIFANGISIFINHERKNNLSLNSFIIFQCTETKYHN